MWNMGWMCTLGRYTKTYHRVAVAMGSNGNKRLS